MTVRTFVTKNYLNTLSKIEDFIWEQTESEEALESFLQEHGRIRTFIEQNHQTPAPHPETGDQSWPFSNGRYRVFFKSVKREEDVHIYFLDLIDNRMLNKKIYPDNTLPTYEIE